MSWTFVNAPEVVLRCAETYLASLTATDLIARKAQSAEEYRNFYVSRVRTSLEGTELARLHMAMATAVKALSPYPRVSSIPWKIAVLEDASVVTCGGQQKGPEDGYPHTHCDIIMLTTRSLKSPTQRLANLLIHEKVHVYQRLFPAETQILILKRWSRSVTSLQRHADNVLARSNPDIGSIAYDGCYQKYKSDRPSSLSNSEITCQARNRTSMGYMDNDIVDYEHPFESMAYMIAEKLMDEELFESQQSKVLGEWMLQYF